MTAQFKATYDRPKMFRTAWEQARRLSTIVGQPASELLSPALKAVWIIERRKQEVPRMMAEILAKSPGRAVIHIKKIS